MTDFTPLTDASWVPRCACGKGVLNVGDKCSACEGEKEDFTPLTPAEVEAAIKQNSIERWQHNQLPYIRNDFLNRALKTIQHEREQKTQIAAQCAEALGKWNRCERELQHERQQHEKTIHDLVIQIESNHIQQKQFEEYVERATDDQINERKEYKEHIATLEKELQALREKNEAHKDALQTLVTSVDPVGEFKFPEDFPTIVKCIEEGRNGLERIRALEEENARLKAAPDKFKTFVHKTLDNMNVPTHPDGPHSKEGCRIGDRLDFVHDAIIGMEENVVHWQARALRAEEAVRAADAFIEDYVTKDDYIYGDSLWKEWQEKRKACSI